MVKCFQKGSQQKCFFLILGSLWGAMSGPLMGSWVLGFLQEPDFEQNFHCIAVKSTKICCMVNIYNKFYTQNESRPNPQHGETAFETSYIGGCLRTLTHTHTHTYTYTRSSGTTFTSSHNREQHLKYSSFLIPIGDFRSVFKISYSLTRTHICTCTSTPTHAHTHTHTHILPWTDVHDLYCERSFFVIVTAASACTHVPIFQRAVCPRIESSERVCAHSPRTTSSEAVNNKHVVWGSAAGRVGTVSLGSRKAPPQYLGTMKIINILTSHLET
jgi:hypothetical protein